MLSAALASASCAAPSAVAEPTPRPSAGGQVPAARSATPSPTADPLAGALAVFVSFSPGKETSSVFAGGERIVLESTKYHVVRALERQPAIRVAFTSSESYAKSYIYPVTNAGRLFVVRVSTDTGQKEIRSYDARTGKGGDTVCSFYSAGTYKGFAIIGDRVYFRTKIAQDLAGRYRSGGDLVYLDMPCKGEPRLLVPRDRLPGAVEVLAAAGVLYAEGVGEQTLDLWRIDTTTGGVKEFVSLKRNAVEPQTFFEGDDALYFSAKGDGQLTVVRLPAEGIDAARTIATIPTRGKGGPSSIDASDGEVYVALADPTPRFFTVKGGQTLELDLDRGLYSTLIHGGGQILRIR